MMFATRHKSPGELNTVTKFAIVCLLLAISSKELLEVHATQAGTQDNPKPASNGATQSLTSDKNKPEPLDDFGLFPQVIECNKEHEMPAPGKLAECEPTCANPRPTCLKIFHVGLDFVPCFCKAPLVRHPKTKLCVNLADCPK